MMENKQELKNKLLATEVLIDNEYLDQYCGLIINNLEQEKLKYQTQKHHIIPRCYFTLIDKEIDDSEDNLINLLYKDHILAHYYLCLCTEGTLQHKLANAFFHLVARKWKYEDFDPETDLSEYQKLYENYCKGISEDRERYKKSSKSLKGIRRSQATIDKIKGLSRSEDTKDRISKNRSAYQVQNLETGEVFQNATKAAEILHLNPQSIYEASKATLQQKDKIAYNFHWARLEEGQPPYDEEERKFILNNLIPPDYSRSKAMRKAQSEKMKGKQCRKGHINSPEHRKKASEALKGRKYSEEQKQKMRKPRSQYIQTKRKDMSNLSTPVRCIDNGKEFSSISEAVKWLHQEGLKGDVRACVAGNQKTAGGMKWEKIEKES